MAISDRKDPYRSFNFQLLFEGTPLGAFSEASGLTAEIAAVDYREGADAQSSVRKLSGLNKLTNITLKRGYSQDRSLWNWYAAILSGRPDRRDVTIVLMNEAREPVLTWFAEAAWITKIEGPSFKAAANEVAMESVELVHEGLIIETRS